VACAYSRQSPWLVGRLPCCVPLSYCNLGVGTSTTRRLACPTLTPMPTPPEQASVSEGPRPADVNLTEVPLCVPSQAVRTLILAASPVLHHTSLNLRALSSRFLLHPHPATSTRTLERGLHPRHCLDANTVKSGFLVRGPCALATSNGASHSHLSFPGLGFPKKCNAHGAVPALAAARLDAHCSLLTANRAVARLVRSLARAFALYLLPSA